MAKKSIVKRQTQIFKSEFDNRIRATYDAAATTSNNRNRWAYTDALSANDANSLQVRRILWQRARYEYDNNSYAKGITNTIAQDCIGTGPRLQMTKNEEIHKELERDFKDWTNEIGYAKKLRLLRISKTRDGEGFALKVSKPKLYNPVKLYLQLFECDQISSHYNLKTDYDGVWLDQFGDVEYYNILENHPGTMNLIGKGRKVQAGKIIHYANLERIGQVRGVSELTPALEIFVQLRAYTLSVLSAAETAANLAGIIYTDASAEEQADIVEGFMEVEVERNMFKSMPYGWKMSQLKAEQPTTTFKEFKGELLNEVARCLQVPFNIAAGNSSGYNYASGRLDHIRYHKAIQIEQSEIDNLINDNIFREYASEWLAVKGLNNISIDLTHYWMYDGLEHVDPVKNANAQKIKLENGTTNLAIESAKDGRDWEDVMRQSIVEKKRREEIEQELGIEPVEEKPTNNNGDEK